MTGHSTGDTTTLLLQLIQTLVNSESGAVALLKVDDLSPLTETAPSHALGLEVLRFSWLTAMTSVPDKTGLARQVNKTLQSLVPSFTGTDAVTLLEFLGNFLRQVDSAVCCVHIPQLQRLTFV